MKTNSILLRAVTGTALCWMAQELQAATNFCPALPAPTGTIITVSPSQAGQLGSIVGNAAAGSTILLQDGTYTFSDFPINKSITLRSQSGNRDAVIIDGNYSTNEILRLNAPTITIANLTIKRAVDHNIHLGGNASNAMIYNVRLIDSGEQFLKGSNDVGGPYNDNVTVACSLFEMTPAGRTHVEATSQAHAGFPCYTGGIDAHEARGWNVRDNVFRDIYCTAGDPAEHAIHFWSGSRDEVIERNILINNARGIGLGLMETREPARTYPDNPAGIVQNLGGVVRNNFIYGNISYLDTAIGFEQAYNAVVQHNTVIVPAASLGIDVRFSNSRVTIQNNLLSEPAGIRDGGVITVNSGNVTNATAGMFVSPTTGNLHLVSGSTGANDKGVSLGGAVPSDIDGDSRGTLPDAGADEFGTGGGGTGNSCDINGDTTTNVSDVQLCVNQAIGVSPCSTGDINNDGSCSVVDVQRVVIAAMGGACQ